MATIANLNILLTAGLASSVKSSFVAAKAEISGLAKAASSMGGIIKGALGALTSPIGLAAEGLGIAASIAAADKYQQSLKKLDAVLSATGNTTGFTHNQLVGMAEDLQKVTNFSERTTIGAEALLATFHNITGDTFKAALHAAMDLTSVMGGELPDNIKKIGRALDNPIAGMKALGKLGVTFSEQQKKSIAAMAGGGNLAGAQQMILGQLQGKFGGAAEAMADPFVQFKNKLESLAESIGGILRPVAVAALNIFGPMVDGITATLKPIIPVVEYVVGVIGQLWQAEIEFLGSTIAPAWEQFMGFLSSSFSGFLDLVEAVLPNALGFISQVFSTILSVGEALWEGMTEIFTSIANVIGLSSQTSGNAMSGMASVFNEIYQVLQTGLLVLEFGFTHWKDVLALAVVSSEFGIVRFANQVGYFFSTVLPAYVSWFGQHWREVFTDVVNFTATVAENIWTNLKGLWDAIIGLFQGNGWDFKPTKLLEGYKSVITELPKIAERQIGPLEGGLGRDVQSIADSVGQSFDAFMTARTATMADSTKKLSSSVHGLFDKLRHPDIGKMTAVAAPGVGKIGAGDMLAGGDGAKLGALVKGSAEAYKAAHESTTPLTQLNDTATKQLGVLQDIKNNTGIGGDDDDGSVDLDSVA
jgi:hypothetical protein